MGILTPAETMAAPEQPQAIAPSSYIPLLRNNVCRGTRASSNPIGVQIYGNTGYNELHFQLLQNTESPWIRNSVFWPAVEPGNVAPSAYNWTHSDAVLRAAKDNCANVIATIDNTPEWATTGDDRSPIQSALLPEYVQFVSAIVERYDGDGINDAPGGIVVNYWEFYNEPDFGTTSDGGGWGEHGDQYAAMLKAVYPAVKAANPNAKVVFGGIALNFFTTKYNGLFVEKFLDDVLDAGGGDAFDIMNLHHYPFPNNRENWTESKSSGLMEKINAVKENLANRGFTGDRAKPLMVTEVGWHSDNNDLYPSSDDFQGRHIVQMLTQSVAGGAMAAIWWTFYDAVGYPYQTGLIEPPNTAKASYVVYRDAVKRLGQAEFVRVVMPATVDNDLEIYEFREGGTDKTMYIAWLNPIAPFNAEAAQTFDDSITQNWQAPGNKATIYSKEGNLLQVVNDGDDGSNDGQITVTIGKSPIYIVIN
jgi:hypothetical protein